MKVFYSVIILSMFSFMFAFCISLVNGYFYPMKYVEEIKASAQKYELDPALIASVINVESSYRKDRVSSKGAIGLMQLMPSTAEWLCETNGEEYDAEKLYEPAYNIELGSRYISYLTKVFEDEKSVYCAYNAGLGNVRSWLKNEEYSADGVKLQKIPFKETASYVNKISKNLRYYQRKY